jgi:uncharacterized protein (TIGR03435 family)
MANTAGPLGRLNDASGVAEVGAGQAAGARQQFDEASIRECDPDHLPAAPQGARGGGANSLRMTPGRTYALCLSLATLVRTAYGYGPADFFRDNGRAPVMREDIVYGLAVEDGRRVRGGPDWVRTEYYTVEAVAAGPEAAETMRGPMLRALLEQRFQLKAHIEAEQIPAFALTVSPGGLKMKEGTCTPPDASFVRPGLTGDPARSMIEAVRKNLEATRRGASTAAPCGFNSVANGPNLLFVGAGAGVPPLSLILGVPVIDRTDIPTTTRFNSVLEFVPDESTPGPLGRLPPPALQLANEPSAVPRAPDIFTALEAQLGLRLEQARAPREFIVIDHVERPSAN